MGQSQGAQSYGSERTFRGRDRSAPTAAIVGGRHHVGLELLRRQWQDGRCAGAAVHGPPSAPHHRRQSEVETGHGSTIPASRPQEFTTNPLRLGRHGRASARLLDSGGRLQNRHTRSLPGPWLRGRTPSLDLSVKFLRPVTVKSGQVARRRHPAQTSGSHHGPAGRAPGLPSTAGREHSCGGTPHLTCVAVHLPDGQTHPGPSPPVRGAGHARALQWVTLTTDTGLVDGVRRDAGTGGWPVDAPNVPGSST